MSVDEIRSSLMIFVSKYSITSMILFGSRAAGMEKKDSDVDLILEFSVPVSLITLSNIRNEMEEALGLNVDVIHGPVTEDDMIEIGEEIVLYAA